MDLGQHNNHILRDFVFGNDLMDRHSNIQFYAMVIIVTKKNKKTIPDLRIMITFDGSIYGEVTLIDSDDELDPYLYPTVLKARYQKMKNVDGYLEITDSHPSEKIGDYTVKIIPTRRLRD